MADLKRERQRNAGPGMTSPMGIADDVSRRAHGEAQEAIEDLYRRLKEITSTVAGESAQFDDTWIRREVRNIWDAIDHLRRRVAALERMFPIFRHARVKAVYDDYLSCAMYAPTTGVEGAIVNVAKPFMLRKSAFNNVTVDLGSGHTYTYVWVNDWTRTRTNETAEAVTEIISPPYFVNDLLIIAKTGPGIVDGAGQIIVWEDLNTGARVWAAPGTGNPIWSEYHGP